jgi:hypothetical protein
MRKNKLGTQWSLEKVKNSSLGPDSGREGVSRDISQNLPEVSRDDGWTRASWIHSLSSSLAEFCQRSSSISSVASLLVPSSISSMTSPLVSSVAPSSISPAVSSLISSSASEEGAGVLEGKTSVSRELWKSLEDLAGGVPEGEGKWSPRIRESSGGDDLALSRLENMCGKLAQLMTREPLASKARLEVSSIQRRLYGYQ